MTTEMLKAPVEVFDAAHLDYDAFCALQLEAYAQLLESMQVSNAYMTPEFYRWKFNPPAGQAKIAVVYERNRMVSTNSMIPVDFTYKNKGFLGWQACDAATGAVARGKGYSSGCLKALRASLQEGEVLYLFPNQNSMGYVQKMGASQKGIITSWVKVVYRRNRPERHVHEISRFDSQHTVLIRNFADPSAVVLVRSAEYLNWRYCSHPMYHYVCFVAEGDDGQFGYAVVRIAELLGQKIALVMELWGSGASTLRCLLGHLSSWSSEQCVRWLVLQDNGLSTLGGLRFGLIHVPSLLLPKKQMLMVFSASGSRNLESIHAPWRIQTGDWDGS